MTTFDNREKDFEAKFKHDAELKFKAMARRNKLLGLWAAEHLGMDGDDADAYARQVVESDFEEPGEEGVFRKVFGDLQAKNTGIDEQQVRKRMEELMGEAERQIMEDRPAD